MRAPGCISCDILAGKRTNPGGVIYENDFWHVDSVGEPVVWRGFLIIKLKHHCEHLADLSAAEAAALGPAIRLTCSGLTQVLQPARVYVCSFGDGVRHIHFWVLPRPPEMRPGMHRVMRQLDLRLALTRHLGVKRWIIASQEVAELAEQIRRQITGAG